MKEQFKKKLNIALTLAVLLAMLVTAVVLASDLDIAVLDIADNIGGPVSLNPDSETDITIKATITGRQVNNASFKVYTVWTLTNGTFIGSSPVNQTVPAREANDAPTIFDIPGKVVIGPDEQPGGKSFTVTPFDVVTSAPATMSIRESGDFSVTVNEVAEPDETPPVIGYTLTPASPDGLNGWYKSDVTLTWTVTEAESPDSLKTEGCEDQLITTDGTYSFSCSASSDGGAAEEVTVAFKRDATAPVITDDGPTTAPNAAGWYKDPVTNTFKATDNLSGFFEESNPYYFTVTSSGEGLAVEVKSGTVSDLAGNESNEVVKSFKIDLTAPTLTWNGGPNDGGSYYFGSAPDEPTCTAVDTLSGPYNCTVKGYSKAVGPHTMTATAYDVAGNPTVETRSYTVLAWTLSGFYRPVDMDGVWNTVKGGSTVPFKFEVFADEELTNTDVVQMSYSPVKCPGTEALSAEVEFVTTGNTSLRYDTVAGQFVFNWQTPKKPGNCYSVTATFLDGGDLTALFKLK
jgi:hypothetical protein